MEEGREKNKIKKKKVRQDKRALESRECAAATTN